MNQEDGIIDFLEGCLSIIRIHIERKEFLVSFDLASGKWVVSIDGCHNFFHFGSFPLATRSAVSSTGS